MARKTKTKKTTTKKRNTRETYKPASPRLRFPKKTSAPYKASMAEPLDFTELTTPKLKQWAYTAPVPQKQARKTQSKPLQHGFEKPTISIKEATCKRRSERKEIIHALKKSGQSGQKLPNLKNSKIKC